MISKRIGDGVGGDAVEDQRALRCKLAKGTERGRYTGRHRPRARVVGLVLVQGQNAALNVEIRPAQRERFAKAQAFARQKAVQDAVAERRAAVHERRVFVRVEVRRGLQSLGRWKPATRQRARLDGSHRINGEREYAVNELRVLSPGRRRKLARKRSHRAVCVFEPKLGEADGADLLVQPRQATDVIVHAALGPDVIGPPARQIAARPRFAELAKRHATCAERPHRAGTLAKLFGHSSDLPELASVNGHGCALDDDRRVRGLACPDKHGGNRPKLRGAFLCLGVAANVLDDDPLALASAHADPRFVTFGCLRARAHRHRFRCLGFRWR